MAASYKCVVSGWAAVGFPAADISCARDADDWRRRYSLVRAPQFVAGSDVAKLAAQ